MIEIMIDLQGGAKAPLYEKIYEHIKNEIVGGKISKGEKLPSTRALSGQLSVSRSTVELAYEQLLAEGYIQSEACRGYYVCDVSELYQVGDKPLMVAIKTAEEKTKTDNYIDFSPYAIDTEHFPYNVWRKLHKNVLLDDSPKLLLSGDGQGDYELRMEIGNYLHQARGVNCLPEQIVIGAGNEYLELLLTQLIGNGKKLVMDDPTYQQAYRTFLSCGYEVKTISAEKGSMPIEEIQKENPDVLYIMPSHQFPLGTVMPMKQRLALLQWASAEEGRYLIEDDYDSEYRYRGKSIPALQSIDRKGKVIYLGTFSKSIAPALRISYMVLPEKLLQKYRKDFGFYSTTVPRIEQEVLKAFISEGHFGRHLNKMRGLYKGKHDFLMSELKKRSWVGEITGDNAGLHVLVRVETDMTELQLCEKAKKSGVKISGIKQHHIENYSAQEKEPIIILGYGALGEKEIRDGLEVLDTIIVKK